MTELKTDLPYSQQAEEALLGAVIIDPDAMVLLDTQPDEFYVHRHRWVWSALRDLERGGVKPDIVTLSELLQRRGKLEEVGGPAFLSSLINRTPNSQSASSYARIVADDYRRRCMISTANQLAVAAYDKSTDPSEASINALDTLIASTNADKGAVHISEATAKVYDEVSERAKNPTEFWGIKTGFIDVDRLTGGLQLGEVFYLAGKPSVGKSKLANQVGVQTAKDNEPTAIYSMEMKDIAVARRILSAEGKIPTRHLKTGFLEGDEWNEFIQAFERSAEWPLYLSDGSFTLATLRADIARLKARHGLKVVVIDYLLLMEGAQGKDDTEKSAYLSSGIKNIARKFDVAVLTVASVTKELFSAKGTPSNEKLRGSGQVVHDADVVAFLTKHIPGEGEMHNSSYVTLSFTKGRDIEQLGAVDLYAHKRFPLFSDIALEQETVTTLVPQKDNGKEWMNDIYRG